MVGAYSTSSGHVVGLTEADAGRGGPARTKIATRKREMRCHGSDIENGILENVL